MKSVGIGRWCVAVISATWISPALAAFTDTGQVNPEIQRGDPGIVAWATGAASFDRGPKDYQFPEQGDVSFGQPTDMLGSAGTAFSLGDGGWITVTFDAPVINGPGADLAVFENGFAFGGGIFMELGFVEVSSDGIHFARLPALARKTQATPSFGGSNPSDFYNLGGNYAGGTGIDLEDLVTAEDPLVVSGVVDLTAITHVRIVDVIGDYTGPGRTYDYLSRVVSDPYPTAYASGGMDLTGIAVLHQAVRTSVAMPSQRTSWGTVKHALR